MGRDRNALIASGVAATASWSEPEERTRTVSHALAGPPSVLDRGHASDRARRLDQLAARFPRIAPCRRQFSPALPLCGGRPTPRSQARELLTGLLGLRPARRWALGELFANSAWAGTLVYSGALFTETYRRIAGRDRDRARSHRSRLPRRKPAGRPNQPRTCASGHDIEGSVAAAIAVALTWSLTHSLPLTLILFAIASVVTAARTVAGTVYGFTVAGDLGREVGAVRAATTQIGYLIGSLLGGAAIAAGGLNLLAVVYAPLFLAATLPYLCVRGSCRRVSATVEA